jgi:hypothetical protein
MMKKIALVLLLAAALAPRAYAEEPRGPKRIDFDERLIKGQTAKTGSVYIYERKVIELRSMVQGLRTLRDRTLRTVFRE